MQMGSILGMTGELGGGHGSGCSYQLSLCAPVQTPNHAPLHPTLQLCLNVWSLALKTYHKIEDNFVRMCFLSTCDKVLSLSIDSVIIKSMNLHLVLKTGT